MPIHLPALPRVGASAICSLHFFVNWPIKIPVGKVTKTSYVKEDVVVKKKQAIETKEV